MKLSELDIGGKVRIGNYEFVKVEESKVNNYVTLLSTSIVKKLPFGDERDYAKSPIRDFCENDFYNELCRYIPAENFVEFDHSLIAANGSGCDRYIKTKVAIPNVIQSFNWYKEMPEYDEWIWTSSISTYNELNYRNDILCVGTDGVWYRAAYYQFNGLAPYMRIKGTFEVNN